MMDSFLTYLPYMEGKVTLNTNMTFSSLMIIITEKVSYTPPKHVSDIFSVAELCTTVMTLEKEKKMLL